MLSPHSVLIVAGPTASGKSALALALAQHFDGIIINADSMQIYDALPIVTACPTAEDYAATPHLLYQQLPFDQACTAQRWRDMAIDAITQCQEAGKLPIICGGTGLYLKTLLEGLSPIPAIDPAIRQQWQQRLEEEGLAPLQAQLAAWDPAWAARIAPADRQRLIRGLEVYTATGRPLTSWHALPLSGPPAGLDFTTIILRPPRPWLQQRISQRLEKMVQAGAYQEIAAFLAKPGNPLASPLAGAIGVAPLAAWVQGKLDQAAALAQADLDSRHYAKRQDVWFKRKIISNYTIEQQFSEKILPEIYSFIRNGG